MKFVYRIRPSCSGLLHQCVLTVFFLGISSSLPTTLTGRRVEQQQQTIPLQWQPVTSYPGAGRHHPITFANETHAFLLTGSSSNEPYSTDFYMYNEATDEWTDLSRTTSAFPGRPRSFGYGIVLSSASNGSDKNRNKAYLGMGAASNVERLSDWWEFDMSTHIWTQLEDFPGPGRRHPAMNAVLVKRNTTTVSTNNQEEEREWEVHVGLGDGVGGNYNDWWAYNIRANKWTQLDDFPSSRRHHPFYFALGEASYTGLGHSDGFDPYIERDWYRFENRKWVREADFASYRVEDNKTTVITTEARVAGTQFSIELAGRSLGFVLSGDGDNHAAMPTGEFHFFDPATGMWHPLPPHPGYSRWAPGSFVMRGSARAYFTSGFDRLKRELHNDVWRIDLSPLFQGDDGTQISDKPTADVSVIPNGDASSETNGQQATDAQDDVSVAPSLSGSFHRPVLCFVTFLFLILL